eukprot:GHVT01061105.1.p1 GENE.GHVT01061105.1~~GHVT01061105.1.p1  ORF type:complete len:639 (+),score=102.71 GHVT01061105.1:1425-3341(+)
MYIPGVIGYLFIFSVRLARSVLKATRPAPTLLVPSERFQEARWFGASHAEAPRASDGHSSVSHLAQFVAKLRTCLLVRNCKVAAPASRAVVFVIDNATMLALAAPDIFAALLSINEIIREGDGEISVASKCRPVCIFMIDRVPIASVFLEGIPPPPVVPFWPYSKEQLEEILLRDFDYLARPGLQRAIAEFCEAHGDVPGPVGIAEGMFPAAVLVRAARAKDLEEWGGPFAVQILNPRYFSGDLPSTGAQSGADFYKLVPHRRLVELWKWFLECFVQTVHTYLCSDFHDFRFVCCVAWEQYCMVAFLSEDASSLNLKRELRAALETHLKVTTTHAPTRDRAKLVDKHFVQDAFQNCRNAGNLQRQRMAMHNQSVVNSNDGKEIIPNVKKHRLRGAAALKDAPPLFDCDVTPRGEAELAAGPRRILDLSILEMQLLIGAHLAARNGPETDKRLFHDCVDATVFTRKVEKPPPDHGNKQAPMCPFTFGRWMAVTCCLRRLYDVETGDKAANPTRDLYCLSPSACAAIQCLLRLGLVRLHPTNGPEQATRSSGGYGPHGVLNPATPAAEAEAWPKPFAPSLMLDPDSTKSAAAYQNQAGRDGQRHELLNLNTHLTFQAPPDLVSFAARTIKMKELNQNYYS